jgi:tetratricopeptide (TPR) repeat protein
MLDATVRIAPAIEEALRTIAVDHEELTSEPFQLRSFADHLLNKYGREEAAYGTFVNLWRICQHLQDTGNLAGAFRYYPALAELARQLGDNHSLCACLNEIGVIYVKDGQFQEALQYYRGAEAISRRMGDRFELVTNLNNIGSLYKRAEDAAGALRYFTEAEQVARTMDAPEKLAQVLSEIGEIYKARKETGPALQYFREVEEIARRHGNLKLLEGAVMGLGKASRDAGEFENGVRYRQEAVRLLEARGAFEAAANLSLLVAHGYENDLHQPQSAVPFYEKSATHYVSVGETAKAEDVRQRLTACLLRVVDA